MWRVLRIPLNESLLPCEIAICAHVALGGGESPPSFPPFLILGFVFFFFATHAAVSQCISIDCSPYVSIKGPALKIELLTFI